MDGDITARGEEVRVGGYVQTGCGKVRLQCGPCSSPNDSLTSAPKYPHITPMLEQQAYGKVLKTGPGYYQNGVRVAPGVKAGQTILFRKGRGLDMKFDGENVLFMTERDLLAVVE